MGTGTGTPSRPRRPLVGIPPKPFTRGNLVAGVTVAAYLVPQVMAYATVAGLPAIVGLWACLPALFLYPFIGTSRLLSLGPESSVALLTAAVIGAQGGGDPARSAALAAGLAIAVGVVGLLASIVRLAFVADLLSRPVMVGYMAGIGVLMIDGQVDSFLGVETSGDKLHLHLAEVVAAIPDVDWSVPLLGVGVLAVLYAIPRISPRLPGPLIAVGLAAAAAAGLAAVGHPVPLVGDVPQGLPLPMLPALSSADISALLLAAGAVTLVAFTDTTLTARAFQARQDPPVNPSAELRALAAGNVVAGFVQGMPVSSSGSRTALARASGGTSQGYSWIALATVVVILVVAAPALSVLPKAGLAALVIYAAIKLIEIPQFRALWTYSRIEFLLAVATTAGVLVAGILNGILIAVALSVLAMLARVARPHFAALGFVPGMPGMHDIRDFPEVAEVPGLLIFRYDSPLFFANAQDFKEEFTAMMDERERGLRWVALNCEAMVDVDSTAQTVLSEFIAEVQESGRTFCLVRAKQELLARLARGDLLRQIGEDNIYPTLPALVAGFRRAQPPS